MKKKFIAIILVVFMCITFSGCSLVSLNATRYSDEVVCKVGDETITRNEISSLFNTYYSYYSQYQQNVDTDTILDLVYNQLINQKVMLNEAKKIILLSNEDKNEIWQDVFDSIDDSIDEILIEDGLMDEEEDEEEQIEYGYTNTDINKVDYNKDTFDFKYNVVINNVYNRPTEGDRLTAFNKFLSQIVATAKANGKSTDSEVAFKDYLNKLYKNYEDSMYVTKYEEYLKANLNITDSEILEKYNNLLNIQKQKYADEDLFVNSLNKSSIDELVLFAPQASFFTVKHILIKFTDEQTKILSEFAGSDTNLDYVYSEPYEDKKEEFADKLLVKNMRDIETGKVTTSETGFDKYYDVINKKFVSGGDATYLEDINGEKKVTAKTIENLVKDIMTDTSLTDSEKIAYFDLLMFIYGEDPGMRTEEMLKGESGYIIPDPDSEEYRKMSFQAEFKTASKIAREKYLAGGYDAKGYEVALTTNGVHIIIFTGMIGNVEDKGYYYKSSDNKYYLVEKSAKGEAVTIDDLKTTNIAGYSSKTEKPLMSVYDYIYETLLAEKSSEIVNNYVSNTKASYEREKGMIKKYKKTYKQIFSN